MVISENIPMTLEVRLNGETLVKGDERSVRVIFNNLTGRNFLNTPPWRTGNYGDYLAMMQKEWGVSFSGAKIELAEVGKGCVESHQFQ